MSIGYKITSKAKRSESISVSQFSDDLKREENLRKLSERKTSVRERDEKDIMMAKASEFVDNGIPIEMAPKKLRDHYFFRVGYAVAVRRKNAMQFIQKNNGRR